MSPLPTLTSFLMQPRYRNYDYTNVNTYQSPYSEPDALEVLHGLLSALHYLHTNLRVAHRDIKPHNILLRFDSCGHLGGPTPLLMDVGSACPSTIPVKDRTAALNAEEEVRACLISAVSLMRPSLTT